MNNTESNETNQLVLDEIKRKELEIFWNLVEKDDNYKPIPLIVPFEINDKEPE